METKKCSKCKREFPATTEYFCRSKTSKSGWGSQCKLCKREHYLKNRETILEKQKKYMLDNKEKKAEYYKEYRKRNKEKLKEYHKEYWKENSEKFKQKKKLNKEHIREVQRAYFRKNPEIKRMSEHKRRALKNNLPKDLSIEQWEEVKAYFENKCAYCGEEKELTQDHFIPVSKNGGYTASNILPACKSCNSSKRDKEFIIWYRNQSFYNKLNEEKILNYIEKFRA